MDPNLRVMLSTVGGSPSIMLNCQWFDFTLWLFNIAMENGPFIDDFPINTSIYKGFSMAMLNNQMVSFFYWNPSLDSPWISSKFARGNGGAFPLPQLDKIASTGNMKNLKCHQFGKWVKGKSHRFLTVPKYAISFGAGLSRSICELPWFWVPELLDALVYAVSQCEYLWNRMRFLFFLYPHSYTVVGEITKWSEDRNML